MKILELSSEFNLKLNSLDEHNIKMQIQKEQLALRLNQEKNSNLKNLEKNLIKMNIYWMISKF